MTKQEKSRVEASPVGVRSLEEMWERDDVWSPSFLVVQKQYERGAVSR